MKPESFSPQQVDAFLEGSDYQAEESIGRGGTGEIWRVCHRAKGNQAVAKILRPGAEAAQAIAHESTILSATPNKIVPRLRFWRSKPKYPCLVMDRAKGIPLDEADADLSQIRSVLRAIGEIHDAGIVHADLKPSHLFIHSSGVQVIDFGASRFVGSDHKSELSPAFSAPELYQGLPATQASDVYSLATILFALFAKQPVFQGGQRLLAEAHCNWAPPQLASYAKVSDTINRIINRALEKAPESRPSISELLEAFAEDGDKSISRAPKQVPNSMARQRMMLLALQPMGEIDELQSLCESYGATLREWNQSQAILSVSLNQHNARERFSQLTAALTSEGRSLVVDERLFSVRKNRKGRFVPRIDGAKLLSEIFTNSYPAGVSKTPNVRLVHSHRPSLVGRELILDNIESLLTLDENSLSIVELIAAPGCGSTRVLEELLERLPGAALWTGLLRKVLVVDDAQDLSQSDLEELRQATERQEITALLLVYKQVHLTAQNQGFVPTARLHLEALNETESNQLFSQQLPDASNWTDEQRGYAYRWTGGLCKLIIEASAAASAGGFVKERAKGKAHFADLAKLDVRLAPASADWVLHQHRELLRGPGLEIAQELCVSEGQTLGELQVTRWHIASTEQRLDLHYGLALLKDQGMLVRNSEGQLGLRSELLRRTLYEQHSEKHWLPIHRIRLQHWLRQPAGPLKDQALSYHGQACKRFALANAANRRIAESSMKQGACTNAEAAIVRSLAHCKSSEISTLLRRRAEIRLRSDRLADALSDAGEAASRAATNSDRVAALLMQSMVYDWLRDFPNSASAEEAASLSLVQSPSPRIRAQLLLARGRSAWRKGDLREARRLLDRTRKSKEGLSARIAALLAPLATLGLGHAQLASAELEQALALCEEEQDWLHLCAALGNRSIVWSAMGKLEESQGDLRRLIELARKTGHAAPERVAAYNLAEDLYWMDQDEEALLLAKRARQLYRSYEVHQTSVYGLLEARILCSMMRLDDAKVILDAGRFDSNEDPESKTLALTLLHYLKGESAGALPESGTESIDLRIEVAYWNARTALKHGTIEEAREFWYQGSLLLPKAPLFTTRFQALEKHLHEHEHPRI